jgi:hypothetical protein
MGLFYSRGKAGQRGAFAASLGPAAILPALRGGFT